MRTPFRFVMLAFVGVLSAACSSESTPTGPTTPSTTINDLVGSWTASSHTFANNTDAAQTFDLVANGGETRTTILTGGRARTWVEFGVFSDEWDALVTLSGSVLTSTPAEATRDTKTFSFVLAGNTLTLTDANSEFDFTLSGALEVSATEVIVFVKQ